MMRRGHSRGGGTNLIPNETFSILANRLHIGSNNS